MEIPIKMDDLGVPPMNPPNVPLFMFTLLEKVADGDDMISFLLGDEKNRTCTNPCQTRSLGSVNHGSLHGDVFLHKCPPRFSLPALQDFANPQWIRSVLRIARHIIPMSNTSSDFIVGYQYTVRLHCCTEFSFSM
jgi:hypothetical protein